MLSVSERLKRIKLTYYTTIYIEVVWYAKKRFLEEGGYSTSWVL